ncbi:MAG: LapA family protein [Erythrobacter sp.]
MQIVRTIIWVLILVGLLAFSFFNWKPIEVLIWGDIIWSTKLPAVIILAFMLGLVPMWAYHRSVKWSLNRRIRSLENAARSNALQKRHDPADAPAVEKAVESSAHKPEDKGGEAGDTLTPAAGEDNV